MATHGAHYEPFAWWLTRERVGQDLRERYPALEELPPRLLALFRNLDSVEGNQLLRACRKRLESRTRHD
jgi:hypothetical protein